MDDDNGPQIPVWTMADRLRKAREHAGLEQRELALDIGVSRNTINNYERGKVAPRRPVVLAWAIRCGVPQGWLWHGDAPGKHDTAPSAAPWPAADGAEVAGAL